MRNELPCTVRWGDTDLYWCVSCWKGLSGLDEVAAHMDDKSRFGNWKKQQLGVINAEVKRLQAIATRFKPPKEIVGELRPVRALRPDGAPVDEAPFDPESTP